MIVSLSQIKKAWGREVHVSIGTRGFIKSHLLWVISTNVHIFHKAVVFYAFFRHYQITLHYFTIQLDEFAIIKTDACYNLIDQRYACFLLLYIIKAVNNQRFKDWDIWERHLGCVNLYVCDFDRIEHNRTTQ